MMHDKMLPLIGFLGYLAVALVCLIVISEIVYFLVNNWMGMYWEWSNVNCERLSSVRETIKD